jgi:UDP-N-acetylglucosamine 4,6-dehydratase
VKFTGIRSGEKLHESMLTREESRHTLDFGDHLVIEPEHAFWEERRPTGGTPLPEGFEYTSDGNDHWLDVPALRKLLGDPELVERPHSALA